MKLRRLAWALWTAASAALWLFENNAATLALLAASVALPILSVVLAKWAAGRASLSIEAPQEALKKETVKASLSLLRPAISCRANCLVRCENRLCREEKELKLELAPSFSSAVKKEISIELQRCGMVRIGAEVSFEDFFGLWGSGPLLRAESFTLVLPELFVPAVVLAENTTVITGGEVYSKTRPGSDPSETFAIREYLPGDPVRQIHWKLSTKSDTVLLRELGLPVVNETLLVFRNVTAEGGSVSCETADAMAEIFLSVCRALLAGGQVFSAAFFEDGRWEKSEILSETDMDVFTARLLSLSWGEDDGSLSVMLGEAAYAHVAVVSADMPGDAEDLCRGNRVTVISAALEGTARGVIPLPFDADTYREGLRYIEI